MQFSKPMGMLKPGCHNLIEKSPCRYRKWSIAEDIDLVVRCELDGVMKYKGQDQLLLIKALNEYDAKSSGRFQSH